MHMTPPQKMHHLYVWCMEAEPKLHPPRHLWTRARCTRSLMARRASATCPATQTAFCRLDRLSLVARGTVVSSFYPFSLSLLSCFLHLPLGLFLPLIFLLLPTCFPLYSCFPCLFILFFLTFDMLPSHCVLPRCPPLLTRPVAMCLCVIHSSLFPFLTGKST